LHCSSLCAALTSVRSAALRQQLATLSAEHGRYSEPPTEKALIRLLEENDGVVVHFYKADFRRCKIVDRHLEVRAGGRRGVTEAREGQAEAGQRWLREQRRSKAWTRRCVQRCIWVWL
jgi:hypothetical protein